MPISVAEVAAQVRLRTRVETIAFIPTDTNADIYAGHLHKHEYRPSPYSEMQVHCDIYYSDQLTEDEKRLVICKELLHILDSETLQVSSREDVAHQISHIVLNPKFQTHEEVMRAGVKVGWDRINGYCAAAMLFPFAARSVLLPRYKDGSLRLEEIVKLIRIPAMYAQFVMSDFWPSVYNAIIERPDST